MPVDDADCYSPYIRFMGRREKRQAQSWAQRDDRWDVFMHFEQDDRGWEVSFWKPLGEGKLPRALRFADPAKITDLYERFGENHSNEWRAIFQAGIERGRGVALGPEQYAKLLGRK